MQDNLFKTTTVSSLNDPFELLYQLTGEMTFAKAKRNLKQRIKSDQFLASVRLHNPTVRTKKDLKTFVAANRDTIAKNLVSTYPRLKAENLIEPMANRTLRVVCFSESAVDRLDEILMWSHYADKHNGASIGFEFPDGITFPFKVVRVDYCKERIVLNLTEGLNASHVQPHLSKC